MKSFKKNFIVYGFLPIISKASGLILLPFYTHYFNLVDFGYLELFLTLFSFTTLLINLEIYTAIGRYFYDENSIEGKVKLISSGLGLTIIFSILVVCFLFFNFDIILATYIQNTNLSTFYLLGILYVFFNAISTYLSVIPRYDNKAKIFTLVNSLAALIKLSSILFFLIFLDFGLNSVIIGHLIQAVFSTICYLFINKKYLRLSIDLNSSFKLLKYAFPLMPFVLLIGFWEPFSRYLLVDYFTTSELGILNFTIRLASLLELVNSAVHMTWMPLLYENKNNQNFKNDVVNLSHKISMLILSAIVLITLISPEIIMLLRASEFSDAVIVINLILLFNYFKIMVRLRGYLPYLNNKTYLLTIAQAISYVIAILFLYIFSNIWGVVGMSLFILLPHFINYLFLMNYTAFAEKISFFNLKENILLGICLSLTIFHLYIDSLFLRYFGVSAILIFVIFNFGFHNKIKGLKLFKK